MPAITQSWLDSLPAACGPIIYFDTETEGFAVRTYASGKRSFIVEWRSPGAARKAHKRRFTIGPCDQIKVSSARKRARELMGEIRLGNDPGTDRKAKREETTIAAAFTEYEAVFLSKLKDRTQESYRSIWRIYILPTIGSKRLSEVGTRDLTTLYRNIAEVKGYPIIARRMVAVFRAFWNKLPALDSKFDLPCPTRALKLGAEKPRERFLSPVEIRALFAAITQAETSGIPWKARDWKKGTVGPKHRVTRISTSAADAIRLLCFTGARLREILHLQWGEVDLDHGLLHLRDSKTGRKSLVLSGASLALLAGVRARLPAAPLSGDAVFPDQLPAVGEDGEFVARPQARSDLHRPWQSVCRAAGLPGVRIHDLRHSLASLAVQSGLSLPDIGKMLGHKTIAATARYSHLDLSSQRRAVEIVAGRMAQLTQQMVTIDG